MSRPPCEPIHSYRWAASLNPLGETGVPIYLSPAIQRVTGFPAEHYEQGGYAGHAHPDDLPAVTAALERVSAEPGSEQSVHARIRRADGGWRWMRRAWWLPRRRAGSTA